LFVCEADRLRRDKTAEAFNQFLAHRAKGHTIMPTIGIMHSGSTTDNYHDANIDAFLTELRSLYNQPQPLTVLPTVWARSVSANLKGLAEGLVAQNVDLIVAAGGTRSAEAAQKATKTSNISVVFTSADHSFSHQTPFPANMTGVCAHTSDLNDERLKLLIELKPAANNIGILLNSNRTDHSKQKDLGKGLKITPHPEDVNGPTTPKQAFNKWKGNVGAALVAADPFFNDTRHEIVNLAAAATIPTIYQWREFVELGGLMSYGLRLSKAYEEAGKLAASILNSNPKKIPPIWEPQSTDFELVINSTTASNLPITVPKSLLDRAEVITGPK
jgi:putative ABC transport system substrate-binding protein